MTKPFAPKVFKLGYIAMEVQDLQRTTAHYEKVIGMQNSTNSNNAESYLTLGSDQQNIILRQSDRKNLACLGFQLQPEVMIQELQKDLERIGIWSQIQSDAQPGIAESLKLEIVPGVILELYKTSEFHISEFSNSGISPIRLGHVAIVSKDAKTLSQFFTEILGFCITDTIGEGLAKFMTCNRDHHVINIVDVPEDKIHHLAFELADRSDHVGACDFLKTHGIATKWGPSRHTAGHNFAAYHHDPESTLIELYTDMDQFIPQLDMCEARPWHEFHPMRPRDWGLDELSAWETEFSFNLPEG